MTAPTYSIGDTVRLRTAAGLWTIREFRLVDDVAVVTRGAYGNVQERVVPVADLVPVSSGDTE